MATFEASLGRVLDEGIDQDVELDVVRVSGDRRRVLMSIRGLLRESGAVSGAIIRVQDVTENARAREELEKRATFDALTRCHNRSSILAALQHELEREDSTHTGVIYVDLDKFKSVNDTWATPPARGARSGRRVPEGCRIAPMTRSADWEATSSSSSYGVSPDPRSR